MVNIIPSQTKLLTGFFLVVLTFSAVQFTSATLAYAETPILTGPFRVETPILSSYSVTPGQTVTITTGAVADQNETNYNLHINIWSDTAIVEAFNWPNLNFNFNEPIQKSATWIVPKNLPAGTYSVRATIRDPNTDAIVYGDVVNYIKVGEGTGSGLVSVQGNSFLRDGKPWIPHGYGITAVTTPPSRLNEKFIPDGLRTAANNFVTNADGIATLHAIKALGGDTVRIMASQGAFDPNNPGYNPSYAYYVGNAVALARGLGLTVILSTQWELGGGYLNQSDVPNDITMGAWKVLVPMFAKDKGVILEIFNEPYTHMPNPSPEDWRQWQSKFQGFLTAMRGMGSENVILVDGIQGAHLLNSQYTLSDPLNSVGYSVHVYFNSHAPSTTPEDWDNNFGQFCNSNACIITEWNAATGHACKKRINDAEVASIFISYVEQKKLGLLGWAFDYPNTMMLGDSLTEPTNYASFKGCDDSPAVFGGGQDQIDYFDWVKHQ